MNYFRTRNHSTILVHVHHSLILAKKTKKPKQNRGIKKDDANKILENNITVKLAISHKTKRWGEFAYFTWYKSTH